MSNEDRTDLVPHDARGIDRPEAELRKDHGDFSDRSGCEAELFDAAAGDSLVVTLPRSGMATETGSSLFRVR